MADYTLSAKITGDASKFQKAMQQAETSMQKHQDYGSGSCGRRGGGGSRHTGGKSRSVL